MAIVGAAIAGIKGVLAAGGIGAFLLRTAASLGLSLLAKALAPKPKQPGVRIPGTSAGEEIPQSFIIGRYATAGHEEYRNSHGTGGTPNEFYQLVISLSDVPGVGLRRLRVNDKFTNLGEDLHPQYGAPMLRFRRGGTDNGWVRFYDGTQTTADSDLVSVYENDPDQPWTTDHKLAGVAYAIVTLRLNPEIWQGVPRLLFVMDGIPLYDPRKDTTAGGSGAHRWDNPATWEPTENLAVQAYNLMRGIPLPDGSIYGGQVDAEDLPFANWIAGMNVCDTTVGSRAQFRGGLEVRVTEEPAAYVEELLKAGLGQISEVGGVFRTRWGAPDMPVFSFTDGDISISDPQQFDPFPGLEGTHNAIRAAHPSAANMWEPVQTPLVTNAEWEASDGNRRLPTELSLAACFNHGQAQQVARAYIEDARRFRAHQIVLPGDAQVLEALDTVEWSSARNGYVNKLFEVVQVQYLPGTLFVALTIRERDPDDYDWSSEQELPPPPELDPTPVGERIVDAEDWTVTASSIRDAADEPRRPALSITWTPEVVRDARALRYQIEVAATGEPVAQGRATPADGAIVVAEGLLPDTLYRARIRPSLDRESDWTDWKTATTPDIRLTDEDLADDLEQRIREAFERHDEELDNAEGTIRELRDRIENLIGVELGGQREVVIPRLADIDDQLLQVYGYIGHLTALYAEYQEQITSAGIYTDPDSGEVRIAGFQRVDDQLTLAELRINGIEATVELLAEFAEWDDEELIGQFNAVSVRLNALESEIVLKASALTVDDQEVRLNQAEIDISGLESAITLKADQTDLDGVDARVNSVEANLDALDVPTIGFTVRSTRYQLLDGDERDMQDAHNLLANWLDLERRTVADAAAQFQIAAWTNDRLQAEATARLALTVEVGANAAALLQETKARADADEAIVEQVNQISAAAGENTAAITQESIVRASEDEALAGQISTVSSALSDAEAEISNLAATRVTAEGAVAAVNQVISAEYGDLLALAEATSFAEATLDGISSGYIWALGGEDILSLIRVDDGSAPVATARIRADYIRLTGDTEVEGSFRVTGQMVVLNADTTISGYLGSSTYSTSSGWRVFPNGEARFRNLIVDQGNARSGNFSAGSAGWRLQANGDVEINSGTIRATLQSANFSAGSDGWRIQQNGNAEFNSLTLRNGIIGRNPIEVGAVSDVELFSAQAPVNYTNSGWTTVDTLNLGFAGADSLDVWTIIWTTDFRSVVVNVGVDQVTRSALFRIQKRVRNDGTWGDWETVAEYQSVNTNWVSNSAMTIAVGPFQNTEFRYQWGTSSTGTLADFSAHNFRNRALLARRTVR